MKLDTVSNWLFLKIFLDFNRSFCNACVLSTMIGVLRSALGQPR